MGIHPGMLVCRSDYPIPPEMRAKLSLFCNVPAKYIIQNLDAESLYQVPLMLERREIRRQGLRGAATARARRRTCGTGWRWSTASSTRSAK